MATESRLAAVSVAISEALRPYAGAFTLCEETEEKLLASLSRLLRAIRLSTPEVRPRSDSESDSSEETCTEPSASRNNECSIKILTDLINLLVLESRYVQHLVGNILVAVSESLASSLAEWGCFVRSLCIVLELVLSNLLRCPPKDADDLANFDMLSLVVFKAGLQNPPWSTAAAIVRVLRNILKYLKQEQDDRLLGVYWAAITSFLSNIPWEFVDGTLFSQGSDPEHGNCQQSQVTDDLTTASYCRLSPSVVFLGNFVQLICSSVSLSSNNEDEICSEDENSFVWISISIVPRLLNWCLGKKGLSVNSCIFQYFRHKLLMLMLRLSYQSHIGLSWMQLLHDYFGELLKKPIIELDPAQDRSLEDSPFLLSVDRRDARGGALLHLQGQAVLLFMRCCGSTVRSYGGASEHCTYTAAGSCLNPECCNQKKGLLELHKWVKGQMPLDASVIGEIYIKKCAYFSRSFLRLYLHEDDALFKVLLELFRIQSILDQWLHGDKGTLHDVEEDLFSSFSVIFNPICLFHLFLSELHYDHQVLLDYLISKDTGTSCAEYLLRCLRAVCDSWHTFTQFSLEGKLTHQMRKKQKTFTDNCQAERPLKLTRDMDLLTDQDCDRHSKYFCKQGGIKRMPVEGAKDCLLSLKHSIENLHQKNLFPYNPDVLLKRLTRFEVLCSDEDDD